jgi:hypothetical protein
LHHSIHRGCPSCRRGVDGDRKVLERNIAMTRTGDWIHGVEALASSSNPTELWSFFESTKLPLLVSSEERTSPKTTHPF